MIMSYKKKKKPYMKKRERKGKKETKIIIKKKAASMVILFISIVYFPIFRSEDHWEGAGSGTIFKFGLFSKNIYLFSKKRG